MAMFSSLCEDRRSNTAPSSYSSGGHGILFVQYTNPDFYPTTYSTAKLLAGQGYQLEICALADRPTVIPDYGPGICMHRFVGRGGGWMAPVVFARFLLKTLIVGLFRRPSLIVGYDLHGLIVARIVAKCICVPFIYHCYDISIPEEGLGRFDTFLKQLEPACADQAKNIIFPSESKASFFVQRWPLKVSMHIVANSPPLQPPKKSDALRRKLSVLGVDPRFIVYYHGSLGPGKGLHQVIESMVYWPRETVLVLIGIVNDSPYFERLMAAANLIGVRKLVHYLGVVPFPELLDFTRSADIGIFLPDTQRVIHIYSGSAIVKLNDYMACGLPFLVADFPPLVELVNETNAGEVVDDLNAEGLGRHIGDLLLDCRRRTLMAKNAYQAHREKYNLETQYQPVLEIIRQSLASL